MSGHSKWHSIRHKKGAADAKRGKLFSRLSKEISVCARDGGGDIKVNNRLRTVVQAARTANMPADNIERAIKKGTGELPGVTYEELLYEGYGPVGVAVMVRVLTDNKNRAAAEIRHIFDKRGGNLAGPGAVAWMFEQKGLITVDKEKIAEESLFNLALEAGAEDFKSEADVFEIYAGVAEFEEVKTALEDAGIECSEAEITQIPTTEVKVEEADAGKVLALINALEDHEDVQNVYANFDIPDEVLEALED